VGYGWLSVRACRLWVVVWRRVHAENLAKDSNMKPFALLATACAAAGSTAAAAGCFYVEQRRHAIGKGLLRRLPAASALTGLSVIPRGHWPEIRFLLELPRIETLCLISYSQPPRLTSSASTRAAQWLALTPDMTGLTAAGANPLPKSMSTCTSRGPLLCRYTPLRTASTYLYLPRIHMSP
jgi:hypothetical protein